jgi:hypothetical protein
VRCLDLTGATILPFVNRLLCLLLAAATAGNLGPREKGRAGAALGEEVEEEVELADEEGVRHVELPEVKRRRWLVLLPVMVMVAIVWNVRRPRKGRRSRTHPP